MSLTDVTRYVNADGFTDDDVAIRQAALVGWKHPDEHLVASIREAYRDGRSGYGVCWGVGARNREAECRRLISSLQYRFPTSRITCIPDPSYHLGVVLRIAFPASE